MISAAVSNVVIQGEAGRVRAKDHARENADHSLRAIARHRQLQLTDEVESVFHGLGGQRRGRLRKATMLSRGPHSFLVKPWDAAGLEVCSGSLVKEHTGLFEEKRQ